MSTRALSEKFLPKNPLFRLLLINGLIGTLVAVLLVAGLIITDAHRIGTLIANAQHPALPIITLTVGLVITFGSVAMGMAIMSLPYPSDDDDDDDDRSGGHRTAVHRIVPHRDQSEPALCPVTVPVTRPRRR
jgi:hypothetical protein